MIFDAECKQVQAIEDELRARVAAENPKKTPDWFIEGRKREGEIVAQYNRKLLQRWIQKSPTATLASYKNAIAKLIAYNKEVEAIRGNDAITPEPLYALLSHKRAPRSSNSKIHLGNCRILII